MSADILDQKLKNFFLKLKFFKDDEQIEYYIPVFRKELFRTLPKIRSDLSMTLNHDINKKDFFVGIYDIAKEQTPNNIFADAINLTVVKLIPIVGIIIENDILLDDPLQYYLDNYSDDDRRTIFRYLDFFSEVISQ